MQKNYEIPPVVWLKVTDYMHAWMQYELGSAIRIREQLVVCVRDLPGARDVLRMETVDDIELGPMKITNAMSANRKNMLDAGMALDAAYIEKEYAMTPELMRLFVPVECPKRCLTKNGVLRRWTLDVCLGRQQAAEMQRLLRAAFWKAVEDFDAGYARRMDGAYYPQIDMIEDFCARTQTPDDYAEVIRREWQRRLKSGQSRHNH